jgi:pheromone shutdown protein TraB
VIIKSSLAGVGALVALAHPISFLLAVITAPFGNFNPIVKPGWVAALAESWLRKPTAEDFENIATDSEHFTGYWKNRVIRIFLVFMLPQLGSSIGTFIVMNRVFEVFIK